MWTHLISLRKKERTRDLLKAEKTEIFLNAKRFSFASALNKTCALYQARVMGFEERATKRKNSKLNAYWFWIKNVCTLHQSALGVGVLEWHSRNVTKNRFASWHHSVHHYNVRNHTSGFRNAAFSEQKMIFLSFQHTIRWMRSNMMRSDDEYSRAEDIPIQASFSWITIDNFLILF